MVKKTDDIVEYDSRIETSFIVRLHHGEPIFHQSIMALKILMLVSLTCS